MAAILDQQQTIKSYQIPYAIYSNTYNAQTFQAGLSGQLTSIKLWIEVGAGTPQNIIAEIQGVDGSVKPDGNVLASEEITPGEVGAPGSSGIEVPITFSSPATLVSGTSYSIVLRQKNDGNGINYYYIYGSNSNPYANGRYEYSTDGGNNWGYSPYPNADFYFKTYVEVGDVETLKDINNDFRMAGNESIIDIQNDFRMGGAELIDIENDFRMAGNYTVDDIQNDFRSRIYAISDINNKINTSQEFIYDITNDFRFQKESYVNDIENDFRSRIETKYDVENDIRIHKKEIDNITNDFRMITSEQIPGYAGVESAGKGAFIVKINGEDKTSILDLDSLNWREELNSSFTASFVLAVPYDSVSCPSENQTVEILFNNIRKFYGYITDINKVSNPEGIVITAKNEYWNLNKTEVDFKVGREVPGDDSTYYNTINSALSDLGFDADIGNFIPSIMSNVGSKADVISQLIQESGNFGWFIKPNGTKKLWTANEGDIITLEKQEIGKNLGLYQVINHNIREDSSGIINKLKVIMGEDTKPGFNNEFRFAYVWDWYYTYDQNYMHATRGAGLHDTTVSFVTAEGVKKSTDIPGYAPFSLSQRWHYTNIQWEDRSDENAQESYEADIGESWRITVPPGMLPGYPLEYKYQEDPKLNWETGYLSDNTEVKARIRRSYNYGGIYPECRRERDFYVSMGDYPEMITKDLVLPSLNVQYGTNYIVWEGHNYSSQKNLVINLPSWDTTTKEWTYIDCEYTTNEIWGEVTEKMYVKIPSWSDIDYAEDYANWQVSKTCDIKRKGTITITMDCADFYNLDLSKKIKILGILDEPLNIISIDYDVSNYLVTINVESMRYYKRTVNIPVHEKQVETLV